MKKMSITYRNLAVAITLLFAITGQGCKKTKDPHIPPDVTFVTGAGYISADATVAKNDTLKVGIIAKKTEDDLRTFNASYAYDGAATTTTFYNYVLQASEYEGYSKDLEIFTRNVAGTERWVFSVVDRDGNITQKTFTLTVQ